MTERGWALAVVLGIYLGYGWLVSGGRRWPVRVALSVLWLPVWVAYLVLRAIEPKGR